MAKRKGKSAQNPESFRLGSIPRKSRTQVMIVCSCGVAEKSWDIPQTKYSGFPEQSDLHSIPARLQQNKTAAQF
jgi:hypothetical protein